MKDTKRPLRKICNPNQGGTVTLKSKRPNPEKSSDEQTTKTPPATNG